MITVAAYAYIFPPMKEKGIQLIENYIRQLPVVGPVLSNSLHIGLRLMDIPLTLFKKAWDPTKYQEQDFKVDNEGCFDGFIFLMRMELQKRLKLLIRKNLSI